MRDSHDNYQEMIPEISHWRISLPKDFIWRSRGVPGALPDQATDRDTYRMAYRRITNYRWMAYWTECRTNLPNDYQEANGYSTDAAYRDCQEKSTKNAPKLSSEWLSRSWPPRPYQMPNQEMPKSADTIYKAAFQEQKRAPNAVSMTTYCETYVLDMDQWYTTFADAIGAFYHPQTVTSGSHLNRRPWRCQEPTHTSLPKVKTRRWCNDIETESIGTPHMTVSQQAEQVKTRGRCNNVEIERTGTSHTTASQQAEQGRVVTGQRATQKDNRSRRKRVCRWSESRTKLRIESPMNPNSNSEIQVTLLPSHDGNRQWIWWRSRRRSNKFSKEGDSRVELVRSYGQPTFKSDRQTHRRQSNDTCTNNPTKKSTRMLLKPPVESATMKSTGWSPKRSSNDYHWIKMCLQVKADVA